MISKISRRAIANAKVLMLALFAMLYANLAFAGDPIQDISSKISNPQSKQIGELSIDIAKQFIDMPYVGGTLDAPYKAGNKIEQLVYDFDKFDCVTFVETAIASARAILSGEANISAFERELTNIRYRKGVKKLYPSRLHYTSEWIIDNELRGNLVDITKDITKRKQRIGTVFFMSKNKHLYPALEGNEKMFLDIFLNEQKINATSRIYIPNKAIADCLDKIQTGDVIAIATKKAGLDYSHVGFAVRTDDGTVRFMHASSSKKKVILDEDIITYIKGNKSAIGISVVRPTWSKNK